MLMMFYRENFVGIFESEEEGKRNLKSFFEDKFPENKYEIIEGRNDKVFVRETKKIGTSIVDSPIGGITFRLVEINRVLL